MLKSDGLAVMVNFAVKAERLRRLYYQSNSKVLSGEREAALLAIQARMKVGYEETEKTTA